MSFLLILLDFHLMGILLALIVLIIPLIIYFKDKSFLLGSIQFPIQDFPPPFHQSFQRNLLILLLLSHHLTLIQSHFHACWQIPNAFPRHMKGKNTFPLYPNSQELMSSFPYQMINKIASLIA